MMKLQAWCAALAGAAIGAAAWGQCQEGWSEAFTPAFMNGGHEASATLYDDGSGPRLIVSDLVRRGDAQRGLQAWDGEAWATLTDSEFDLGNARLLHADHTGAGPRLFAALADLATLDIADVLVLEGGDWRSTAFPLDFGFNRETCFLVDSLTGDLYLAGLFRNGGEVTKVYRWDGGLWTALDSGGPGASASDLDWFDDGSGRALYAGVRDQINGVAAAGVAKWDGHQWSEVGGGCPAYWPELEVFDDGSGPALWALASDGSMLAKWDGAAWTAYPLEPATGFTWRFRSVELGGSRTLVWLDSGTEAVLWRWDGVDGEPVDRLLGVETSDLVADPTGIAGGGLVAVGNFVLAGEAPAACVAAFDGSEWAALGTGDVGNGVWSAQQLAYVGQEGGPGLGERLYASALAAGGAPTGGIAAWDGTTWESIGATAGPVYDLAFGDLGRGPRLFAAGLLSPEGSNGRAVMAWDGEAWSVVADGIPRGSIAAMAFGAEAGADPMLFVGGSLNEIDGQEFHSVAGVSASGWVHLGGGLPNEDGSVARIEALAVHDDGSGPALYAGGRLGDLTPDLRNGVVRWAGGAWERVGGEFGDANIVVRALASGDVGDGMRLYAGGTFRDMGNIVAWDGAAWTTVGGGFASPVLSLGLLQTADGPRLAASVDRPTGDPQERVYLWDGHSWAPFGALTDGHVLDLAQATHEDGAVYLVGGFTEVAGVPSEGVARWGCLGPCPSDFNGDGVVDTRDFVAFLDAWARDEGDADFDGNGTVDTRDFVGFLNAWSAGC